ncbi:hypothetical protein [Catalinimonas niigatensis]|uniref:hypothetical protein n=1 Tax=Catalinimonas niigatensis TaxID=1397264 RepID=UPI002666A393|nr:hypothetical protein [Catalinimonas niigatensis]WPP49839.1 hypothetical protein PZB72_24510 [Catalinimonas niigatensis]
MKKVDKIFLVDDDSIANFVNQHLIKGLEITRDLKVIHSIQLAKQEVFSLIEQLDGELIAEFIILLNISLDLKKELLPSYLYSSLPLVQNDGLLMIGFTYNKINDPVLMFQIEGFLTKPITREKLSSAWQKLR